MKPASGEARKRTTWANSSGSQNRPTGNLREQRLPLRLGELLGDHRRVHVRRRDAVRRHAVRRELPREREGERGQRALRDRVGRPGRQPAGLGGERAGGDDPPPAPALHVRHHRARQVERAVEVRREHAPPLGVVGRLDLVVGEDAGVVHQDVDRPEPLDDARVPRARRRGIADVEGDREDLVAELARARIVRRRVHVDHRDAAAVLEQDLHRREAHRPRGAGDERDLALQRFQLSTPTRPARSSSRTAPARGT